MRTIKQVAARVAIGVAVIGGTAWLAPVAQAEFIINVEQDGSNVVATGSGSIDFTDLIGPFSSSASAFVFPSVGDIYLGPTATTPDDYYLFTTTGPENFGSGFDTSASTGGGDLVGASGGPAGDITVPDGYVSGTSLSDSATWDNATFSSLGLTSGTYTWTWGTGADADSLVLNIGSNTAVPEPATLPLLGSGLIALGLLWRHKRKIT